MVAIIEEWISNSGRPANDYVEVTAKRVREPVKTNVATLLVLLVETQVKLARTHMSLLFNVVDDV